MVVKRKVRMRLAQRTLAIGDVHGCQEQLEVLLDALRLTGEDHVVFLGDYVDRGPDSKGVIDRVLRLSMSHRVTTIMGNHEEMMLAARADQAKRGDWMLNGGDATLRSYGGVRGSLRDVPGEHWTFLENGLVQFWENQTHIFVHANAYADCPMSEQPDYMLRWERFESVAAHGSGKVLVCGHTPQKSGVPVNRGFAICIDTHACKGGNLTCLDADSGRVWMADSAGKISRAHISDFAGD